MTFVCKYCQRPFTKEKTLTSHICVKKRRFQQENETGVQLGFNTYLKFYQTTQINNKKKTYDDFVDSNFYNAFVKFGRYLVDIRCINASSFVDWLLKNNKKLDHWCKEGVYMEWLNQYMCKESVQDAMERALKEMQEYADNDPRLENSFSNYFRLGAGNRICKHISDGRISPWIVFNCTSGINWLSQINQEQLNIIMPIINPDFWNKKFFDYSEDQIWVKRILADAGL